MKNVGHEKIRQFTCSVGSVETKVISARGKAMNSRAMSKGCVFGERKKVSLPRYPCDEFTSEHSLTCSSKACTF